MSEQRRSVPDGARSVAATKASGVKTFIGLGSNLGDRSAALDSALHELALLPETTLLAVSSRYESSPVEADGADYLNAVVLVRTTLAPLDLLHAMQRIEDAHGRERPYRHAPRRLDLDLLLHGDRAVTSAALTLPHPRLHERAFVLAPLHEIAPDLSLPGLGSVETLLRGVAGQRIRRLAAS